MDKRMLLQVLAILVAALVLGLTLALFQGDTWNYGGSGSGFDMPEVAK